MKASADVYKVYVSSINSGTCQSGNWYPSEEEKTKKGGTAFVSDSSFWASCAQKSICLKRWLGKSWQYFICKKKRLRNRNVATLNKYSNIELKIKKINLGTKKFQEYEFLKKDPDKGTSGHRKAIHSVQLISFGLDRIPNIAETSQYW